MKIPCRQLSIVAPAPGIGVAGVRRPRCSPWAALAPGALPSAGGHSERMRSAAACTAARARPVRMSTSVAMVSGLPLTGGAVPNMAVRRMRLKVAIAPASRMQSRQSISFACAFARLAGGAGAAPIHAAVFGRAFGAPAMARPHVNRQRSADMRRGQCGHRGVPSASCYRGSGRLRRPGGAGAVRAIRASSARRWSASAAIASICRRSSAVIASVCRRSSTAIASVCRRSPAAIASVCRRSSAAIASVCRRSSAATAPICRRSAAAAVRSMVAPRSVLARTMARMPCHMPTAATDAATAETADAAALMMAGSITAWGPCGHIDIV